MRHFRASTTRKVSLLMVSLAGIGLLATSALAVPTSVISLAGNVDSGKYYDVDEAVPTNPSSWQWVSRQLSGTTIVTEAFNVFAISSTATIDWGSPLMLDASVGGLADGTFESSGTMTITGTFTDLLQSPLFTGVLLEANVSSFQMLETGADSDILFSVGNVIVSPTGGWLVDGLDLVNDLWVVTNTYAYLDSDYSFGMSFSGVAQNGGGPESISDFTHDIWATSGSQFVMGQVVPEPATLALLGMGLVGCVLRRRR